MNCNACVNVVLKTDKVECQICHMIYHYSCLGIGRSDYSKMIKQNQTLINKCPSCKSREPKSNNILTPVRDNNLHPITSKQLTLEDKELVCSNNSSSMLDNNNINLIIKKEMKEMKDAIDDKLTTLITEFKKDVSEKFNNLVSTTDRLCTEIDGLKVKLSEFDAMSKKIIELESKLNQYQIRVASLESDFNNHQQWLRRDNIEVQGVPELKNEKPTDIIIRIATHAGVEMKFDDIVSANRVQPLKPISGRHKNIVVKLKNPALKSRLTVALRKCRGVTSADIGIPGKASRIFVNEHLTAHNKKLLKLCKEKCSSMGYKYTWVKNSSIYVRKSDGTPFFQISTELDLDKII